MASKSCCKCTEVKQGENKVPVIYEESTGELKTFIPFNLRKRTFNIVHKVADSGGKATLKILQQRDFWPNMRRDTMESAKILLDCQQCKIYRHVKNKIAKFKAPESRFDHI